jgi:formylglycine-generating enzyme required for sulfatase activity
MQAWIASLDASEDLGIVMLLFSYKSTSQREGNMRFVNFYRKPISMFVMIAFTILLCFQANQSSAAPNVATANTKARELLLKGNEAFKKYNNPLKALSYFEQAVDLASGYIKAEALLNVAYMSHIMGNKIQEYQNFVQDALTINPERKLDSEDYQASFMKIFNDIKSEGKSTVKPAVIKPTTKPAPTQPQPTVAKSVDRDSFAEEGSLPVVKKKKKFPLLLVILGVGVVAALVVLLAKKKTTTPVGPYNNGVLTIMGVRYELAAIPAGTFQMGSNSLEAQIDEQPVHTVQISKGFWIGKTEVTQGLWQAVMGSNPSYFKSGDNYPVETVSWDDCQGFIAKLNQMVGGNAFRLPTEAEWEYACRAGTTGDRYGNIDAIAWYGENSDNTTHIVGQKQANAWGLFDTLGNVYEWCQDWYGAYSAGYQTDPTGPASGYYHVLRGGSYYYSDQIVRSAYRYFIDPSYSHGGLGLRLARTNE